MLDAIRAGYRLIDTAASYTNEDAVGEAVREAIAEGLCTREELFITSKMWVQDMQNYDTAKRRHRRLPQKALGLEYLDLYLLHQAMKDYFSAWRAMEDAYRAGKLRAIGVSNFYPHTLTNFCETVAIRPDGQPGGDCTPTSPRRRRSRPPQHYKASCPRPGRRSGGGRYNPFDNEPCLLEYRRGPRQDRRAGRPALERPARRRSHPEVRSQGAHRGELRASGTSS